METLHIAGVVCAGLVLAALTGLANWWMSNRKRENESEDVIMKEDDSSPGLSKREEHNEDVKMKEEDENSSPELSKVEEDPEVVEMKEDANPSSGVVKVAEDCMEVKMRMGEIANNLPISRKQFYDEACQEIKMTQEAIRRVRHKVEQLTHHVDEASNQLEKAIYSLKECNKHWVSFLAIPETSMRHILKYLKFEDKANFRLSSQTHRDIIDCFDDDFKSLKVYLYDNKRLENGKMNEILETRKDIKLKFRFLARGWSIYNIIWSGFYENKGSEVITDDEEGSNYNPDDEDRSEVNTDDEGESEFDTDDEFGSDSNTDDEEGSKCNPEVEKKPSECNTNDDDDDNEEEEERGSSADEDEELRDIMKDNEGFLTTISARLIELEASPEQIDCIPADSKVERITLVDGEGRPAKSLNINKFGSSLKVLELRNINMSQLQFDGLSLPNLEKLQLSNVIGFDCVVQLLASCSKSLEHLSLNNINGGLEEWNFLRLTINLTRLKKFEINFSYKIAGIDCLLRSASDNLKILDINSCEESEGPVVFSLPKLEKLKLRNCHQDHLSILKYSPRLSSVAIHDMDLDLSSKLELDPVTRITGLSLHHSKEKGKKIEGMEACKKIIAAVAATAEQLDLNNLDFELGDFITTFPKLSKVSFDNCNAVLVADILCRSPSLKVLDVDNREGRLNLEGIEKLRVSCENPDVPGLCDLLNTCSSTLEELCICSSFSKEPLNLQGLQVMQVLKNIKIQCSDKKGYQNVFSGLNELLKQCSKSVEKLVLNFPSKMRKINNNADQLDSDLLTLNLDLPNLKILQIDPRPADNVVRKISLQLPKNVTLWFFPSSTHEEL